MLYYLYQCVNPKLETMTFTIFCFMWLSCTQLQRSRVRGEDISDFKEYVFGPRLEHLYQLENGTWQKDMNEYFLMPPKHKNATNQSKWDVLNYDIEGMHEEIKTKINGLNKSQLKLLVAGDSGTGKSTLINTIRGLHPNESGAAKVGVTGNTKKMKYYVHPNIPRFIVFDMPGIMSANIAPENQINLDQFNGLIICSAGSYSEFELWLGQEAERLHIPYVFVRNKVNIDIINSKEDEPEDFDERKILRRIRASIKRNLKSKNLSTDAIFLLSAKLKDQDKWDFPFFLKYLKQTLPKEAENAFLLSLLAQSLKVFEMKEAALRYRIPFVVNECALQQGFFDGDGDKGLINQEIEFYFDQLDIPRHKWLKILSLKTNNIPADKSDIYPEDGYFGIITDYIIAMIYIVMSYLKWSSCYSDYLNTVLDICIDLARTEFIKTFPKEYIHSI